MFCSCGTVSTSTSSGLRETASRPSKPPAAFLARYCRAVARQERAGLHALGIVRTHVHVLLQLHPTTSISKLMQRLKGGSYDIESVSPRAHAAVHSYVLDQARHHPDEAIPGWDGEEAGGESQDTADP